VLPCTSTRAGVTFKDSGASGTLVTAYEGTLVTGGSVPITVASHPGRAVLESTGTSGVLLGRS